jgi:ribosome biogenesis protein NSA2
VTHPELKATFCLDIIGIKKNPNGQVSCSQQGGQLVQQLQ